MLNAVTLTGLTEQIKMQHCTAIYEGKHNIRQYNLLQLGTDDSPLMMTSLKQQPVLTFDLW